MHKALGSVISMNNNKVNGARCNQPCNPSIWEAGAEDEDVMVVWALEQNSMAKNKTKKCTDYCL